MHGVKRMPTLGSEGVLGNVQASSEGVLGNVQASRPSSRDKQWVDASLHEGSPGLDHDHALQACNDGQHEQ